MTRISVREVTHRVAQPPRLAAHRITASGDHAVTFTGGMAWELRHPNDCDAHERGGLCPVWVAAQRTLNLPDYLPGTYRCEADARGWLRTKGALHHG